MAVARMFMLNLHGGGGDLACDRCLAEAKRERRYGLISVAKIDAPGESCPYCGIMQGERHAALRQPRREPTMAEHFANYVPDPATDVGYGPWAGND